LTIFEAAVKQKVEEEIARLEEAYAETLEEQVTQIKEDLSSNVDDYLNYVVEQWVTENEVAIEAGLRTELTEEFITGLRQLFAEHYIDIPEDKVSVVEEMSTKVSELEEKLNEEIERNVVLNKMINESKQYEILVDACDGLTTTQAEKLKALSEGVEYTSPTEYSQKINILRESYFNSSFKSDNVLDNNEVENDGKGMISEELKGPMAAYVRTLGKKLPN
jgi:AcrR family transcriptional regulator